MPQIGCWILAAILTMLSSKSFTFDVFSNSFIIILHTDKSRRKYRSEVCPHIVSEHLRKYAWIYLIILKWKSIFT